MKPTLLPRRALRGLRPLLFLAGLVSAVSASAYTFTKTVPLNVVTVDGDALGVQPGDVIGIVAGERTRLVFVNIEGEPGNPVIIANMGGKVRVGNDHFSEAIRIANSRYFELRGDGDPAHHYGIEVFRAGGGQGVDATDLSTNYELCFLEIHHTGYAGIMSKTDPRCDNSANQGVFFQHDVRIHDNYVHDTHGEGLYIGNSFHELGQPLSCGRKFPHDVIGLRVYNNIVERTGRDGIQVGSATSDCEIYNNFVRGSGLRLESIHGSNLQIGEGTTGKCYNNTLIDCFSNGIAMFGLGNNTVFNNVIVNSGRQGIFNDDRADTIPGTFVRIFNNTVVDAAESGFKTSNTVCTLDVRNNIFIASGAYPFIDWQGITGYTASNNVTQSTTAGLSFINTAAHDYRIGAGSGALNAGANLAALGVTTDREGLARPAGAAYDLGASEYGALSAAIATWSHPTPVGASNGSLTVTAIGGTPPYTYLWSTGATTATATGLASGTYSVTVTDAAATQRVRAFTLVDPPELTVNARVLPALAGANDGSIALTPRGTSPYSVVWAHGPTSLTLTGLAPGFYTYTLTDGASIVVSDTLYVRDGGTPLIRVNVGGLAESDRVIGWALDKEATPSPYVASTGTQTTGSDTWNGSKGNFTEGPNNLFGGRRYKSGGNMSWAFPVTNGYHEVQLYFNEGNDTFGAGSRVFDVAIEGATVLDNFDVFAVHGYNSPAQYTWWIDVTDGTIDLDFLSVVGSPMGSAIAIHTHTDGLPTGTPVHRVNAGGPAQTDTGLNWQIDKNPSSLSPYLVSTGQLNTGPNTWSGTNTTGAPNNIFANYRYDPNGGAEMQWEFPLPAGSYRLNLYYMERDDTVTGPGQRYFDVAVEGTVIWTDHDPYAAYGGRMKPGRESIVLDVTDGELDVDFFHKNTRAPIVSGLSIHRVK